MSNAEQPELELGWPPGSWEKYREVYGKWVKVTVPVKWWSAEWHSGMRSRTYVGMIKTHHAGGVCMEPPPAQQGWQQRNRCFPLTDQMVVEVLTEEQYKALEQA
jgi:hypothetical protein